MFADFGVVLADFGAAGRVAVVVQLAARTAASEASKTTPNRRARRGHQFHAHLATVA
ncbi:MAG: hypothetical protein JO372_21955 [Solirubrobacterales bacterium]|nr:hypothetical protein [Solirubrobacterales bacterium]